MMSIWLDVHEILTQDVNIYPLSGNIIFFHPNFLSTLAIWTFVEHLLQKFSLTIEIWHLCN